MADIPQLHPPFPLVSTSSEQIPPPSSVTTTSNTTRPTVDKKDFLAQAHQLLDKAFKNPKVCCQNTIRTKLWRPHSYESLLELNPGAKELLKSKLETPDVAKFFPRNPSVFRLLAFSDEVHTHNSWFNSKVQSRDVLSYLLPLGYVAIVIRMFVNNKDSTDASRTDKARIMARDAANVIDPLFSTLGQFNNYEYCIKYGGSYISPKNINRVRYFILHPRYEFSWGSTIFTFPDSTKEEEEEEEKEEEKEEKEKEKEKEDKEEQVEEEEEEEKEEKVMEQKLQQQLSTKFPLFLQGDLTTTGLLSPDLLKIADKINKEIIIHLRYTPSCNISTDSTSIQGSSGISCEAVQLHQQNVSINNTTTNSTTTTTPTTTTTANTFPTTTTFTSLPSPHHTPLSQTITRTSPDQMLNVKTTTTTTTNTPFIPKVVLPPTSSLLLYPPLQSSNISPSYFPKSTEVFSHVEGNYTYVLELKSFPCRIPSVVVNGEPNATPGHEENVDCTSQSVSVTTEEKEGGEEEEDQKKRHSEMMRYIATSCKKIFSDVVISQQQQQQQQQHNPHITTVNAVSQTDEHFDVNLKRKRSCSPPPPVHSVVGETAYTEEYRTFVSHPEMVQRIAKRSRVETIDSPIHLNIPDPVPTTPRGRYFSNLCRTYSPTMYYTEPRYKYPYQRQQQQQQQHQQRHQQHSSPQDQMYYNTPPHLQHFSRISPTTRPYTSDNVRIQTPLSPTPPTHALTYTNDSRGQWNHMDNGRYINSNSNIVAAKVVQPQTLTFTGNNNNNDSTVLTHHHHHY